MQELSTRTCVHILCKQKKGQKWEKRSKKAKNSPAHPLAQAKKEFIALIIKIEINKIHYFEVSVIKSFFQKEKYKN